MTDVGVDIGMAKIAIASPGDRWADSLDIARRKLARHEQLREMKTWLLSRTDGTEQLWIDRPLFHGTGTNAGERLTETVGMILSARDWIFPPQVIYQQTWKAQVIGNGNASKADIQAYLEAFHPELANLCHGIEDEYDAMTLGVYGQGRRSGAILAPVKATKKRVLKR